MCKFNGFYLYTLCQYRLNPGLKRSKSHPRDDNRYPLTPGPCGVPFQFPQPALFVLVLLAAPVRRLALSFTKR